MCMMVRRSISVAKKLSFVKKVTRQNMHTRTRLWLNLEPLSSNFKITTDPTAAVTASTDDAAFPINKVLTGVQSTTTTPMKAVALVQPSE